MPEGWCDDVAAELVRVELARRGDEVDDRLGRIDAHHDPDVAELQVEVDQQRVALEPVAVGAGEAGRDRRLADAALGREDRDDAALAARAGGDCAAALLRARRVGVQHVGAPQREHERLGQLGQDGHVLHAVGERLLEELRRAARGHDDDRRRRLPDCSVWMSWVGRRSPRLEPWRRTSTCSSRRRSPALGASTAVPTTLMASCGGERLANLGQAGARAGDEDADRRRSLGRSGAGRGEEALDQLLNRSREAVAEHRLERLDGRRRVQCVLLRALGEPEAVVAVLGEPEDLLRVAVAEREQDVRVARNARRRPSRRSGP